jgi:hypothetical protein
MKSSCLSLLLILIFSCGSNQSVTNNTQSNTSKGFKNSNDCLYEVTTYVINSYTQYGQLMDVSGKNGSYIAKFEKPNPASINFPFHNSFSVVVDENCKVVSSKHINAKW